MSNQNVEYKHTLGGWVTGQTPAEVEASVQGSTQRQLGAWAKGEVDAVGKPVKAEKPKKPGKGGKVVEDADDEDVKVLNGETPVDPLVK
jgi:hypothetical protein